MEMEKNKKNSKLSSFTIELLDLIRTILICVICVFICTTFLFKPVRVEGDSMKPTLLNGEYGFSNVFSILNEDYQRFDVVVVHHRADESLWVKRIIGMPGDTVELTVELIHPIAIENGTKFSIREGGRTVGAGNVIDIIE